MTKSSLSKKTNNGTNMKKSYKKSRFSLTNKKIKALILQHKVKKLEENNAKLLHKIMKLEKNINVIQ